MVMQRRMMTSSSSPRRVPRRPRPSTPPRRGRSGPGHPAPPASPPSATSTRTRTRVHGGLRRRGPRRRVGQQGPPGLSAPALRRPHNPSAPSWEGEARGPDLASSLGGGPGATPPTPTTEPLWIRGSRPAPPTVRPGHCRPATAASPTTTSRISRVKNTTKPPAGP